MKAKQRLLRAVLAVALVLALAAPLLPRPAQASYEDAAIFYDELAPYGSWVDYDKYGPVWYPSKVEEDWRPYTNGRWVPSEQGYLFETDEPWGWATYHYGNWMPTENYGWVWVPGRTWYPNTVAWRHSPETVAVDTSYIGWAPIPPPNYVPPPAYAPPNYYPGMSPLDLLVAPFWIFAQATRFLLGFGQPYTPAYSYYGCGCLAPVTYVPVIYPATVVVHRWYYPSYYQPVYFGGGLAVGAYAWGPPVTYVSRVTNINQVTINNYIKTVHVNNVRGGWPDTVVFNRNPHLRKIVPVENPVQLSRIRPMEVRNVDQAVRHLGNPRAIVQPAGLKPLDRALLPKATVMPTQPVRPDQPVRVRGMDLPKRAQQQITPQMAERLKSFRPAGAEGPAGPGVRRGPGVAPEGPQKGIVGGPQEVRGRRVGPGEGPGVRRGPVEGFQGPAEHGVRRGPVEPPEGAKGVRRGPVSPEAIQAPGGVRRGPVTPPGPQAPKEWSAPTGERPGVRRGPVEGFQEQPGGVRRGPVEGPGVRRGPVTPEGFQPPGTPRQQRPPAGVPLPEEQRRRLPKEQLQQMEMEHQRLQRSGPAQPQGPPQIRPPQEQQRRMQMQQQMQQQQQMRLQQQEQRRLQQQQLRQQQEQQRQMMQQQQQLRKQQEQQRRQEQQQRRQQQMRPPQEQSRAPQVRPEVRHAQVQALKKDRQAQQGQSHGRPPVFGER